MAWIYLLLAAACETAWTFCLKFMKLADLKTLRFINFYKWQGGLPVLLPFFGYIIFGLVNIYLFSLAIKQIATAIAFAVWTAATLVLLKIVELLFFHQKVSFVEGFFIMLILVGIIGLKSFGVAAK